MEEFIQILIFVGAMIISLFIENGKSKKKSKNTSPKEVLHDMFPEIEKSQEEKQSDSKVETAPVSIPQNNHLKTKKTSQVNRFYTSSTTTKKKEKRISINSKEEAKRAFIYSEIFNRKY